MRLNVKHCQPATFVLSGKNRDNQLYTGFAVPAQSENGQALGVTQS
jgi:hypothetical protein